MIRVVTLDSKSDEGIRRSKSWTNQDLILPSVTDTRYLR